MIPEWLYRPEARDEERIAQDLISLAYWSGVEERARAQVLSKIKKEPGWSIKMSLEKQSLELQALYSDRLRAATEEITTILGSDIYARARMMAEGADASFDTATDLSEVLEQVQTRIAIDINEMGLLPYLEYSSIAEYLLNKRTPWNGTGDKPGSWYEIEFMVSYLVPTLEANGFPRKLILGVAENFHKARFATGYLKEVLADIIAKTNEIKAAMAEATEEEERLNLDIALQEALRLDPRMKEMLEILITEMGLTAKQGGLSVRDFRERMRKVARRAETPNKVLGYVYNLRKGGVMMISVDDTPTLNALKAMTGKLVDWHLGSPEDLAREAGRRLLIDTQPEDLKEALDVSISSTFRQRSPESD